MKKGTIIALSAVALIVITVFIFGGMYFGYNREEVKARNACEAQVGNVENVLDNMWKNFQEIGGIADRERETAMELFVAYAGERSQEGQGKMMAWITEQNPTIDSSLYKDLQARLTAGRQEFRGAQTHMLSLVQAHSDIVEDPFKSMFIKASDPYDYKVISSSDTKAAVESGEDERVFSLPGRE